MLFYNQHNLPKPLQCPKRKSSGVVRVLGYTRREQHVVGCFISRKVNARFFSQLTKCQNQKKKLLLVCAPLGRIRVPCPWALTACSKTFPACAIKSLSYVTFCSIKNCTFSSSSFPTLYVFGGLQQAVENTWT